MRRTPARAAKTPARTPAASSKVTPATGRKASAARSTRAPSSSVKTPAVKVKASETPSQGKAASAKRTPAVKRTPSTARKGAQTPMGLVPPGLEWKGQPLESLTVKDLQGALNELDVPFGRAQKSILLERLGTALVQSGTPASKAYAEQSEDERVEKDDDTPGVSKDEASDKLLWKGKPLDKLTVAELKGALKQLGLVQTGLKADLLERLAGTFEEDSESFPVPDAPPKIKESESLATHRPEKENKKSSPVRRRSSTGPRSFHENADEMDAGAESADRKSSPRRLTGPKSSPAHSLPKDRYQDVESDSGESFASALDSPRRASRASLPSRRPSDVRSSREQVEAPPLSASTRPTTARKTGPQSRKKPELVSKSSEGLEDSLLSGDEEMQSDQDMEEGENEQVVHNYQGDPRLVSLEKALKECTSLELRDALLDLDTYAGGTKANRIANILEIFANSEHGHKLTNAGLKALLRLCGRRLTGTKAVLERRLRSALDNSDDSEEDGPTEQGVIEIGDQDCVPSTDYEDNRESKSEKPLLEKVAAPGPPPYFVSSTLLSSSRKPKPPSPNPSPAQAERAIKVPAVVKVASRIAEHDVKDLARQTDPVSIDKPGLSAELNVSSSLQPPVESQPRETLSTMAAFAEPNLPKVPVKAAPPQSTTPDKDTLGTQPSNKRNAASELEALVEELGKEGISAEEFEQIDAMLREMAGVDAEHDELRKSAKKRRLTKSGKKIREKQSAHSVSDRESQQERHPFSMVMESPAPSGSQSRQAFPPSFRESLLYSDDSRYGAATFASPRTGSFVPETPAAPLYRYPQVRQTFGSFAPSEQSVYPQPTSLAHMRPPEANRFGPRMGVSSQPASFTRQPTPPQQLQEAPQQVINGFGTSSTSAARVGNVIREAIGVPPDRKPSEVSLYSERSNGVLHVSGVSSVPSRIAHKTPEKQPTPAFSSSLGRYLESSGSKPTFGSVGQLNGPVFSSSLSDWKQKQAPSYEQSWQPQDLPPPSTAKLATVERIKESHVQPTFVFSPVKAVAEPSNFLGAHNPDIQSRSARFPF